MGTTGSVSSAAPAAPEELLALALSRPQEALSQARVVVATSSDAAGQSYARQAAGIVLRDSGDTAGALVELRAARRAAGRTGDRARQADVRATLGATLVIAGQTSAGMSELDAAVEASKGQVRARILLRRAYVLTGTGRYQEALDDMRRALAGIRSAGDVLWEARALNNRAGIHLLLGAPGRADRDAVRAQSLFREAGQEFESLLALQNRGVVAYLRGDLPGSLRLYDEAARGYADQGVAWPELALDRCQALLSAGLPDQAVVVVDEALAEPALQPVRRAELLYAGGAAALADGDPKHSRDWSRQAARMFRHQGREWWEARARLVGVMARRAEGGRGGAVVAEAEAVARDLTRLGADEASVALVQAGELLAPRHPEIARAHFAAAGGYRRRASPLVSATGWLGQALERELTADRRGVFFACGRGLDALDEYRSALGSSELRALASGHGRALASLALREAVAGGDARRLLTWSERWRATALSEPPVRPPEAAPRAAQLAAVRSQALRLDEAMQEEDPDSARRERAALEQAVRHQRHLLAGTRRRTAGFDLPTLLADLGDTTLLELVEVDGELHVMTVQGGRVRARSVGPVDAALQGVGAARFVLRQAARGRPSSTVGVGERLQTALLGGPVPGDGPVVVAPPSRLHAAPWGLMPAFADRPVSVVPSALMWQRARSRTAAADGRTVLVAGPGLGTGGAEVDVLARLTPGALLLRDGTATVERSLAALDGARLAHVAAHGDFRPDSPMFSSLVLDDGPLTVHDLELLHRAPHRLLLSACDSGVMVPVGADELLGLTSALLSLGTAGVLASVAEVNDEATVPFMLHVHARLAAGDDLASALLAARTAAADDPLAVATAASFVALGV